tara:strand:- start:226 stop:444 length:219 start_codon:yes stop_codon:yes gene_type:complete
MGIFKWLCKRFSCKSNCTFNPEDCDTDLLSMDLSQYVLKIDDLKVLQKIRNKRASVHKYVHPKNRGYPNDEV